MSTRSELRSRRSGFTLVELLVVIAIIGILVALLLPAIQAAREAARRAKCQNNIKNVGLACLTYESTKKHLPPGFVATTPTSTEAWAWSTFILPYVEEQAIYDQLRPSETFLQPVDGARTGKRNLADLFKSAGGSLSSPLLAPLQTPLSVFRCPSDSTPDLIPVSSPPDPLSSRTSDTGKWERHFNGANSPIGFQPSTSNYVASKGVIDAGCPFSGGLSNKERCDTTGVFFGDSRVSIKQITDGTGKTFLVGERDKFCLAATWIGVRNPLDGAESWSSIWAMAHAGWMKLNHPITGGHDTCTEGFSSAHPGGAFFAFCDGSVHFINDDIDFNLGGNTFGGTSGPACYASPSSTVGTPCRSQTGNVLIGIYQRLAWRSDGLAIDGGSY